MADLSAVLRKTIDGLPNATPELRAKVYEKARAAIVRQIENANPPLSDDVVDMRRHALEEAIQATEAHYCASGSPRAATLPVREEPPAPSRPAESRSPVAATPPAWPRRTETPPPAEPTRMPRAETPFAGAPSVEAGDRRAAPRGATADEARPREDAHFARSAPPIESTEPEGGFDIPDADTSAPRYAPQRAPRRAGARRPLAVAVLAVVAVGAIGAGAYLYRDRITSMIAGETAQTAAGDEPATPSPTTPPASDDTDVAALPPSTPPAGEASQPPAASPKRRFTQRLQPDGTEVDAGPAAGNANAFDEGTNIAAATPETVPAPPAAASPAIAPPTAPAATPATPAAPPAAAAPAPRPGNGVPAVAQRAMFYEERTDSQQGTQQVGNVVWSLVSESPGEGQPPEPVIRAVADLPNDKFKMTMTIRRNLDATLPASHVIELQFDVPPGFSGGQVVNVQRLALKPSEEARGDPLIGVAGKISDGFFIIALNNLDKATQTNLALLGNQEWIDVPIAYATGRRALMSIEKGVPGDRIFKEALDAWAAKT